MASSILEKAKAVFSCILLYFVLLERILCVLGQTSFCGEVGFGIWLKNFPWCLKAKFQIPPLRRRMFVINTTTVLLQVPRFVSVQCTTAVRIIFSRIKLVGRRNKWCLGKSKISKFSVVFQIPNSTSPQKDVCD